MLYSVAIDKQIKEEQHMGKGTRSKKKVTVLKEILWVSTKPKCEQCKERFQTNERNIYIECTTK